MISLASFRPIVLTALIVAGLAYGCGRTSLDEGVALDGSDNGLGGARAAQGGASGRGGTLGSAGGGSGPGGTAGRAGVPCGASTCTVGSQACCARIGGGQTAQTCVSSSNPTACLGGISAGCVDSTSCSSSQVCCISITTFSTACTPAAQCAGMTQLVLCTNDAGCPATAPTCCLVQPPALRVCLPRGVGCN